MGAMSYLPASNMNLELVINCGVLLLEEQQECKDSLSVDTGVLRLLNVKGATSITTYTLQSFRPHHVRKIIATYCWRNFNNGSPDIKTKPSSMIKYSHSTLALAHTGSKTTITMKQ